MTINTQSNVKLKNNNNPTTKILGYFKQVFQIMSTAWCMSKFEIHQLHTHGSLVISRSFIEELTTVLLGSDRGRQVNGDHLQKGFSSRQPAAHDSLQERLALLILVLIIQLDVHLLDQFGSFILSEVHDGIKHLEGNHSD